MKNIFFLIAVLLLTLPLFSQKVVTINTADFKSKVYNYDKVATWKYLGTKPAVIDFYADWCRPCKTMSPILEELALEYGDKLIVYKINVDNEGELSSHFKISSIPCFYFIPVDGEPNIEVGSMSKSEMKKNIDKVLKVN